MLLDKMRKFSILFYIAIILLAVSNLILGKLGYLSGDIGTKITIAIWIGVICAWTLFGLFVDPRKKKKK